MHARRIVALTLITVALSLTGCKKQEMVAAPDYSRPLPPGSSALRKIVDQAMLPDLTRAYARRDEGLLTAMQRSVEWFSKPSTQRFFPAPGIGITHSNAHASVFAFRQILASSTSAEQFQQTIRAEFDTYMSVGWNDNGIVLYTGYCTPEFDASTTRSGPFQYPIYSRPSDLVTDPATGAVMGRRVGNTVQTYPTRAQIEQQNLLAGSELVYFRDAFEAYIVQVNGSAKLNMTDGSVLYVGYAGTNGHEYTSIGRILVEEGRIEKNRLSLATLREYFRKNPQDLPRYSQRNDRFVFFQQYDGVNWPAGSLGFKVETMRSLATDKDVYPRGGVVLASTNTPVSDMLGSPVTVNERFDQLMLDQDTGGAIRAPGRADIYMGLGAAAEQLAGRQFSEGYLYYFFLKPHRQAYWAGLMAGRN